MKSRAPDDGGEYPLIINAPPSRRDEDMAGQGRSLAFEFLLRFQAWKASITGNVWMNRLGHKMQVLPVGKDFMLLINSQATWGRIAARRRGWMFSAVVYLFPVLIFSGLIEAIGLFHYGQGQIARGLNMERYSAERLAVFEVVQAGGFLGLIFIAAVCMKSFGNACHNRNRLHQGLLVMVHAIGPLILLQAGNGIPGMSVWITWVPGVIMVMVSLYYGVPRILRPDPPSAMGLFVATSAVVFLLSLFWRLLTYWYLSGEIKVWAD